MADIYDDIFNPRPEEIIIGDPKSYLFTCGKNENHELSFKGFKYIDTPSGVDITKKHIVVQVSCGSNHTAYVTEEGYLYLFGSTLHGKLGIDNIQYTNISNPILFPLSKDGPVQQVACGDYHTLCLFENGEVWGWGGTLHKKLAGNESGPSRLSGLDRFKIVKIGCGDFHSVALSGYLNRQGHPICLGRRWGALQQGSVRARFC